MRFEPNRLLVTGGAGFIGSNFVQHWLANNGACELVVLDALTYAGNIANLAGVQHDRRYEFVRGDICNERLVLELFDAHKFDTVVHFAAESHVDRSILGPDEFVRTNILGTHSLLKVAKTAWLERKTVPRHRFHHISTDEVYGSLTPGAPAFSEATAYAPNSPYSASKAGSDHLVRAYFATYGLDATMTNCSNNYGPYQFPEKLIPLSIVNILRGKVLPVYGDGLQIRDWLHVEDHCRAISLALRRGLAGEVYNIGGEGQTTNIGIVHLLCDILDRLFDARPGLKKDYPGAQAARGEKASTLIEYVRDRPGHDRRYAINHAKAAREFGYEPAYSLASGLARTVEWYVQNRSWWEALLGRNHAEWIEKNYKQR